MSITKKIIIVDTNIISDLNNAGILKKFVELDNICMSDLIKNDEINFKTGDINLIKKIAIVPSTSEQLIEVVNLMNRETPISTQDLLNYVLARDNDYILATGDNKLKNFSEENGVKVIRTLYIIKSMKEHNILSCKEAIDACMSLKENPLTRIPSNDIINLINELEKDSILI